MNRSNRMVIPAVLAAAALGLAACGERPADTTVAQAPSPATSPAPAQTQGSTLPRPTDAAVVSSVRAALAGDPQLRALGDVDVEASGGKVTLKGSAPNSTARDRAGQVVASVRGVTSVDNQLKDGS